MYAYIWVRIIISLRWIWRAKYLFVLPTYSSLFIEDVASHLLQPFRCSHCFLIQQILFLMFFLPIWVCSLCLVSTCVSHFKKKKVVKKSENKSLQNACTVCTSRLYSLAKSEAIVQRAWRRGNSNICRLQQLKLCASAGCQVNLSEADNVTRYQQGRFYNYEIYYTYTRIQNLNIIP